MMRLTRWRWRRRLRKALWRLTTDPLATGIVIAMWHYPRPTLESLLQREAREAETVAYAIGWARTYGISVSADHVRAVLDAVTALERAS